MRFFSSPKYDVYLSHSSVDSAWVSALKRDLRRYKINSFVWADDVPPGTRVWKAIKEASNKSKMMVYIASPEAKKSKWVQAELDEFMIQRKKVIPLILRDLAYEDLPASLQEITYLDFRDESDYSENVWRLVKGIAEAEPKQKLKLDAPEISPPPGSGWWHKLKAWWKSIPPLKELLSRDDWQQTGRASLIITTLKEIVIALFGTVQNRA